MSELAGDIRKYDRLIWEPERPHAREEIMVTEIAVGVDNSVWIKTVGRSGEWWNEIDRVREACIRHPHPLPAELRGG